MVPRAVCPPGAHCCARLCALPSAPHRLGVSRVCARPRPAGDPCPERRAWRTAPGGERGSCRASLASPARMSRCGMLFLLSRVGSIWTDCERGGLIGGIGRRGEFCHPHSMIPGRAGWAGGVTGGCHRGLTAVRPHAVQSVTIQSRRRRLGLLGCAHGHDADSDERRVHPA
jgi:hypothetical protein